MEDPTQSAERGQVAGSTSATNPERSVTRSELAASMADTLSHTDTWFRKTLTTLGWTMDHINQKEEMIRCPVDSSHIVAAPHASKHSYYCPLLRKGYTKQQLSDEATRSSQFFYEKSNTVVTINTDDETMKRILSRAGSATEAGTLPVTMERAVMEFTAAQKSCIYQYCIESARATNKVTSIPLEDLQLLDDTSAMAGDQPMSEMELKQQNRDLKRRRQSYRKKNIHTGKKNYLEVIHEVIEQQTGLLADRWGASRSSDRPSDRPSDRADRPSDRPSDKADTDRADRPSDRPSDRADRPSDRADRPSDRAERTSDRADRSSDRPSDKADTDRADRPSDRPSDRADRPSDRADRPSDRADRPSDRAERTSYRADRPSDRVERTSDRADRPSDRAERTSNRPSDRTDRTSDKGFRRPRSDRSESPSLSEKGSHSHRHKHKKHKSKHRE